MENPMIKPEVLDALVAAGCTAEQIAAAVKADMGGRTSNAERQARFRARKKALLDVTNNVTSVTVTPVSPKKEIPPTPPKEKTTPSVETANAVSGERDFFSEFWLAYPRREGPNPRKPAKLVFDRLIAKGRNPEAIIAAAKAFAAENPTPTRFITQAQTWLGQERFDDAEPVVSGDEFCAEDWPNTRFLVIRFRNEHGGSDPPRAVQGGKAGYLIPAEWVAISKQRQAANGS